MNAKQDETTQHDPIKKVKRTKKVYETHLISKNNSKRDVCQVRRDATKDW